MQRQRFEVELRYPEDEHVLNMPTAGDLYRWLLERLVAEAYYARPERVEVRQHKAGVDHPDERLRTRLYRIASAAASGSEDPRPLIEALASDLARQTTAHPSEEDLHP